MPRPIASATSKSTLWDRIGTGVSGVCIVHCLLLPAALVTVPLWPALGLIHGWIHFVFAAILIPITILAAFFGYRKHRRVDVLLLLGTGLAVLLAALALGHDAAGAFTETTLTLGGSGLLIAGHWRNRRTRDGCADPHDLLHRHC